MELRSKEEDAEYELYAIQAEFCKGLAHPKRILILNSLKEGEKTVNDLAEVTGIPQSNVSQHLAILRQLGILGKRREGLNIYYSITDARIVEACELVRETIRERIGRTNRLLKVTSR